MSATFQILSIDELNLMSLPDLQAYATQVSTIILDETSTINGQQQEKDQYDYLMLISESTISGLDTEIFNNINVINANIARQNAINFTNLLIDQKISDYTSTIDGCDQEISITDIQIAALNKEYQSLSTSLLNSDIIYKSTATQYSSMYVTYLSKKSLHEQSLSNINIYSTIVQEKIINEKYSYSTLQGCISAYSTTVKDLELLYINSNTIKSTLTQYTIDKEISYRDLTSTNIGIIYLSSMYITNVINRQYYEALSTQTYITNMYIAANSTFIGLSISQTGGGRKNVMTGGADTTLSAAIALAKQRNDAWLSAQSNADAQVSVLQKLLDGASTDTYGFNVAAAGANIQMEMINISTFNTYANSSLNAVIYYSSIYEAALLTNKSSLIAYSTHLYNYDSSIAGSNSWMALAYQEQSTIQPMQDIINSYILESSFYATQLVNFESSVSGWISYSTLLRDNLHSSVINVNYYSTIYESTNKTIEKLNVLKGELAAEICAYEGTVRANYCIRQAAICGVKKYENLINMDVIGEEFAAFTYRETCGRKKRLDLQKIYDTQILDQIQATSTINGNMLAAKQLVPPVLQPINLNTAAILTTNDYIKSVQISIDTFPNIYNSYTAHSTILTKMNASIENEYNSYSTIAMLSTNLLLQPGISSLIQLALDNEYNRYIQAVNTTASLKENAELTRLAIDNAKAVYTNSIKTTVFPLNEQLTNEVTISSFLKEGWDSAVTLQTGAAETARSAVDEARGAAAAGNAEMVQRVAVERDVALGRSRL